jgi:hypothetical protein
VLLMIDMIKRTYSRRSFVAQAISSAAAVTGAAVFISSCGEKKDDQTDKPEIAGNKTDDCEDFSGLTDKDLDARKKLGYVKTSPIQDSKCGNCQLWLPPREGRNCGNCQLFKGPVYTGAYCTYWAPQNTENG